MIVFSPPPPPPRAHASAVAPPHIRHLAPSVHPRPAPSLAWRSGESCARAASRSSASDRHELFFVFTIVSCPPRSLPRSLARSLPRSLARSLSPASLSPASLSPASPSPASLSSCCLSSRARVAGHRRRPSARGPAASRARRERERAPAAVGRPGERERVARAAGRAREDEPAHRPRGAAAGGGLLAREVLHGREHVHAAELLGLRGPHGAVGVRPRRGKRARAGAREHERGGPSAVTVRRPGPGLPRGRRGAGPRRRRRPRATGAGVPRHPPAAAAAATTSCSEQEAVGCMN